MLNCERKARNRLNFEDRFVRTDFGDTPPVVDQTVTLTVKHLPHTGSTFETTPQCFDFSTRSIGHVMVWPMDCQQMLAPGQLAQTKPSH